MSSQPYSEFQALGTCRGFEEQQQRKSRLLSTLSEDLPTLPSYIFEVNDLLSATPVDLRRVSKVIRTDPSLAAQAIRLCNSALLSLPRRVFSTEEAVILLGTERLRTLVLTCPLLEYAGQRLSVSDIQSFWQHGFLTAQLSERIAQCTKHPHPEQVYLAGLLHDVGALPLLMISSEEEWQQNPPGVEALGESVELEQQRFGVDHCEVGRHIGISWNFPPALVEVFEHHHDPWQGTHDLRMLGVVAAADQFCEMRGVGLSTASPQLDSADHTQYDELLRTCLSGLDAEHIRQLVLILNTDFLRVAHLIEFGSSGRFGEGS